MVCLTAAALDILLELGLAPIGYLSQGVADQPEFYGEQAKQFARVGSWMMPNLKCIRQLQPDLVLGWSFPHRFYRRQLGQIPLFLLGGTGYETALERLRRIALLTHRQAEAEVAITRFQSCLAAYRIALASEPRKTVLLMGGSLLNRLWGRFIIETQAGTLGSLLQQFTDYPWAEPGGRNFEPGLTNASLQQILEVNPEVIFVQTYPPARTPLSRQLCVHPLWRQLHAVRHHQVYEINRIWHSGNGTRQISNTLNQLLPLIYPHLGEHLTSNVGHSEM